MNIPESDMLMADIQPPRRMLPPQSPPFQERRDWRDAERQPVARGADQTVAASGARARLP